MYTRLLKVPKRSFFLFGPRSTGKSTWIKANLKNAKIFNLLENNVYLALLKNSSLLREQVTAFEKSNWIVIDEVQRIPDILNEVHILIEDFGYHFALTGSSARKLRKTQSNLLAGRALTFNMFPLTHQEYGGDFSIEKDILAFGSLPIVLNNYEDHIQILESYTGTYIKEEIKEEAHTRSLDAFVRFLEVAAIYNGQITNLSNTASDAGVARSSVTNYFEILVDTLIGFFLPAWTPRLKVKERTHPKFYFFDTGVVRAIQGKLHDNPSDIEKGILLETYLLHELRAYISYNNLGGNLCFWRTHDDIEIDFIWKRGTKLIGIEVKASKVWKHSYESGMKSFLSDENHNSTIDKATSMKFYGVYLGKERLKKEWGLVLPVEDFLQNLYAGKIITA